MEEQKKSIFENPNYIPILSALAMLLWGSAFPTIKIGYELFEIGLNDEYGRILFAGVRFTIAGIVTIILAGVLLKRFAFPKKIVAGEVILLGLIQTGLQYFFFYIGIANTTGTKGAILGSVGAFFIVILSHFYYKNDKLNGKKGLGCILGFLGVVIINLGKTEVDGGFSMTAEGFMIISSLAFGIGSLISKQAAQKEDSVIITGYQLLFGGILLSLIGIAGDGALAAITIKGILVMCYLVFISTVAFTLWTVLLKHNNVSKMGVYYFLVPVFGVMLSAIFLGENPWSIQTICALLLVCVGIYAVNAPKRGNG